MSPFGKWSTKAVVSFFFPIASPDCKTWNPTWCHSHRNITFQTCPTPFSWGGHREGIIVWANENISLTWHRLLLGIVIYPLHSRDHVSDVYDVEVHHGYGWVSWFSPSGFLLKFASALAVTNWVLWGTNHFINCAAWCLAACGCRTTIFNKWIE